MYVDDVYYSRINGALFSLFDVARVEVLRGPQGTFYGKNSTGGAIKVITKEPGSETAGAFELTAGNYGRAEGRFYVTSPLSDTASFSFAAAKITRNGYVEDPVTHQDYNDENTTAARLKLAFHPNDDFSAVFALDYTDQDNALTLGRPTAPLQRSDLALGVSTLLIPPLGNYNFQSRTSFSPDIDIDASQLQIGDVLVAINQNQFSQELQFQYGNGSNVQATYGLYYLRETVPSHQEAYANDFITFFGTPITFLRTIDDDLRTTSRAAFGQVNYRQACVTPKKRKTTLAPPPLSSVRHWQPLAAPLPSTLVILGPR